MKEENPVGSSWGAAQPWESASTPPPPLKCLGGVWVGSLILGGWVPQTPPEPPPPPIHDVCPLQNSCITEQLNKVVRLSAFLTPIKCPVSSTVSPKWVCLPHILYHDLVLVGLALYSRLPTIPKEMQGDATIAALHYAVC